MWTYVHREFLTIFGQCINVLNYNVIYLIIILPSSKSDKTVVVCYVFAVG